MSAEAVGRHMPAVVTLDDLTAMNGVDPFGHRYETSPEGVLSVLPPADSDHAKIASRIFAWLIMAGGRRSRFCRRPVSGCPDLTVTGAGSPM